MKVGDLIRYKERALHRTVHRPLARHVGIVLEIEDWAHASSNNVRVMWNTQRRKILWHHVSVLEVVNESR